ncbi:amino acid--tRNA ligase-related protein [Xenorhabdus cabanillasii]|uniref:Lysine--tRNA ligase n=1 Tax=Xenorhabdus cabanillasii JM26 TaxID=1427517 RepID=W1J1E1_9GAMM|nr:amino acid--tRNA ligase-related protein [Xenorhabdus cabanillasii]PHM75755.1 lysyl-tRNA synthetase [Xenorhabdus cabanillasii JM26]CDL84552.1 putative Lysine--tRNA ligase [Xenorhabdus cabanillasii JM26]
MLNSPILYKAALIRRIRTFLDSQEFIEIMTPVMRRYAGDSSRPRLSLHNGSWLRESSAFALRFNLQFYDRIYEIGPSFRPDAVDATHLPEFTMLDLYKKDSNLDEMLQLAKSIIEMFYKGKISIFSFADHLKQHFSVDLFEDPEASTMLINCLRKKYSDTTSPPLTLVDRYIIENIEPLSQQCCMIVTDFPLLTEIRAKKRTGTTGIVERFEILIDGIEIVHGYTDEDNVERFEAQARELNMFGDEDVVICSILRDKKLSPYSAGFAIGIERLCQVALGEKQISILSSSLPFSPF